jgi:hypothetical protein
LSSLCPHLKNYFTILPPEHKTPCLSIMNNPTIHLRETEKRITQFHFGTEPVSIIICLYFAQLNNDFTITPPAHNIIIILYTSHAGRKPLITLRLYTRVIHISRYTCTRFCLLLFHRETFHHPPTSTQYTVWLMNNPAFIIEKHIT